MYFLQSILFVFICNFIITTSLSSHRSKLGIYQSFISEISAITTDICTNNTNGVHTILHDYCYIGGQCYNGNSTSNIYECLKCSPEINQIEWTIDSKCSAGDKCADLSFLASHVCDISVITAFYTDPASATVSYYDFYNCSKVACQPGFFFALIPNGNSTPWACCPGFFCPEGQICMIPCRQSAYCPSPLQPSAGLCNTDAQCLPSGGPENFELLGCGGSASEGFCPAGYYCPNASTRISCENQPSRYCPSGVTEPINCPFGFICPNGTLDNDTIWTIAMCVVMVLLGILIVIQICFTLGLSCECVKKGAIRIRHSHCCRCPKKRADKYRANNIATINIENIQPSGYFLRDKSERAGMSIKLHDVCLNIPKWKDQQGFTFTISPGRINAIMGQSGCGKTSLLYAVQGRTAIKKNGGKIVLCSSTENVDEHPLKTSLSNVVGYVPQEDVMHSDLTVYETIYYSGKARRSNDVSAKKLAEDINFILDKLDMTKKTHELIEKLSGGERKRVNIAVEMIACSKVLLLDEPTSGLDSVICDRLFDLLDTIKLNQLCHVNIIMIIHQPSAELFERIDHLILLTPGCYLAYQGERHQAFAHLRDPIDKGEINLEPKDKDKIFKSQNECDK
ncbi:unnamed protein product, partial [Didymodactylos carnosus]